MEYTSPANPVRSDPQAVSPTTLLAVFATVPDPRRRQGTRFPLPAILTLAVAAILANHRSVLAIAEWGASQSPTLLAAFGFPKGVTPHQSTLQRLFRRLDPVALSTALTRALEPAARPNPLQRGSQGVAIDGKAQRGRLASATAPEYAVHALSACCHKLGVVLAQLPIVEAGDKSEAELTVAPRLLAGLDWRGRVFTGDALFCQRNLCQQVVEAGGDYRLLVKENQPQLHADLHLLFDSPAPTLPLTDRREAETRDYGQGRYEDRRHLIASTDLTGYSDWPALAQIFRLHRTWWAAGQRHASIRYGITSLPPEVASAERLLALGRGHWTIENRLHYVKDVVLGEDQSLIHCDAGPAILAIFRDTAVSLLRRAGYHAIAARLRHNSRHPQDTLPLLGLAVPQNA
ncbi:ISAs1 family transposase [Nitrolancea hollandica]|uniref:Transposase n=1 Tax=Nitrolancea hollandica Lb TaxID=1129897 RepID=I4EMQ1_9BACT|nr:ISAs1 family transposase [Nitrolancea hollandica]CCF85964.1 transposase [Nitrolancea hollandica Lb]